MAKPPIPQTSFKGFMGKKTTKTIIEDNSIFLSVHILRKGRGLVKCWVYGAVVQLMDTNTVVKMIPVQCIIICTLLYVYDMHYKYNI